MGAAGRTTLAALSLTVAAALSAQEPPAGTLLVSNMDGSSVWLLDLPAGTVRARLTTRSQPHEVAVSQDGRRAAVTNYGPPGPGNLVQIIDVEAGTVVEELTVSGHERLHGAAFLPGDSLLALTSERTNEVLVVSAVDGSVRRVLPTGGAVPHMLALASGWVYAANIVGGSVSRIDPSGVLESRAWPAGTRTEGVAATPDGREGWTGSMDGGTVIGIDGERGQVLHRVAGFAVPYRLAVSPDGRTVVVTDPEAGELVLVDRHRGEVSARVDVDAASRAAGLGAEASPQGFALSTDGAWAFVSAKAIDRVAVVHLPSRRVIDFLETGEGPDGIAFTPAR